ncbi:MAG: cytochrome c oxidase subunit II [Xanthomonadaceae bacterium]|nr:cytochrome c oxidase subunit II [Xanthomonadaceae bacterium]
MKSLLKGAWTSMFFVTEALAQTGLPPQGTEYAARFDSLYNFLIGLSAFFFAIVIIGMVVFAIKYRDRAGWKAKYIHGNTALEIFWTAIPTVLVLIVFAWGWILYKDIRTPPSDAMEIKVIGKQWLWQFQYEDGRTLVNEVYVPVGKPVKLIMTSDDVLHGFFIPNFRIKRDVVPGMHGYIWFEATKEGRHQVYCTAYCGTAHSGMLASLYALNEKDWSDFQRGKKINVEPAHIPLAFGGVAPNDSGAAPSSGGSLAEQGKKLSQTKGCVACHTEDGTTRIGPSYKGLWGSKVELADGSTVIFNEDYVTESIYEPNKKVVKGFVPSMPTFKGQVSAEEINALIAYFKSIK